MDIRIYDFENLPFGSHIKIKTPNGIKKAIVVVGYIALPNETIPFEQVKDKDVEIYI